jgi:hypothetical protein
MFYASWPGIWRTQTANEAMGDETCHRLPLQTSQAYSHVWCAWGLDLPHWYTWRMQIALCPTLVNHNKLLSMTSWALLTSAGPALLTPCSLCAGSLLQSTCNWGWSSSNEKRIHQKKLQAGVISSTRVSLHFGTCSMNSRACSKKSSILSKLHHHWEVRRHLEQ